MTSPEIINSSVSTTQELHILVVRPDRIGDVILSTPVFEVLKKHYPKSKLTVMVREPLVELVKGLASVDDVMVFAPEGKHRGVEGFFRLISEIRDRKFRIAIVLQSHWKVAAALFGAGVRHRVGPLSKPHSFLFYNRGVRQRRSGVEMHETDYNLQLLRRLGIRVGSRNFPTRVSLSEDSKVWADAWLKERNWKSDQPLIVVHPGMGGSALNWPETHYIDLIKALVKEGKQVLLTGGPADSSVLGRVQDGLGTLREQVMVYGGPGTGPISQLGALLARASLMVAPSTGPMHLAVAIGVPVVTFFPPIRVQSAIRWGPYLPDETRASIQVPDVYCGQEFKCLGNLCNYFPCMKGLTVNEALEQAHRLLKQVDQPVSSRTDVHPERP